MRVHHDRPMASGWSGDPPMACGVCAVEPGGCVFPVFWGTDDRFQAVVRPAVCGIPGACVHAICRTLRLWSARSGFLPWLAFLMPLGILAVIRYAPFLEIARLYSTNVYAVLGRHPEFTPIWVFVGFSYMAFRTSHLVLEVRNGVVPRPSLWEYLGFAFFAPTMSVGPINPYSQYRRAFEPTVGPASPRRRAFARADWRSEV